MNNYFAFRLRKDANNYYRYINGEVVLYSPPPSNPALASAYDIEGPDGWRDEGIRRERHPDYHGLFTSYSEGLRYVYDGAEIIKYVYDNEGVEGELQLEVLVRRDSDWLYTSYFIGDIDFSTFLNSFDGITVNTKDAGASALIKANDSVSYEVDMSFGGDIKQMLLTGVVLLNKTTWTISDDPGGDNVNAVNRPQMTIANSETGFGADVQTSPYAQDFGNINNKDNRIYISTYAQTLVVDYDFSLQVLPVSGVNYAAASITSGFFVFPAAGGASTPYFLYSTAPGGIDNANHILKGTINIPVNVGDILVYTSALDSAPSIEWHYNANPSLVKGLIAISFKTRYPASYANVIRYFDLAKAVLKQLAPDATLVSSFLNNATLTSVDSRPYWLYATCGDALRRLSGARLSITWKKIFQDLSSIYGLGIGVEGNVVRIEPLSYFYQDQLICDLGEVTNFEYAPAIDMMGNQLNVGYADQDYDTLNGKDETNVLQEYKLPINKVKTLIEFIADSRTDRTGAESLRINLTSKDTTDNKADTEVFLFELQAGGGIDPNGNPYLSLYQPNATVAGAITGIGSPDTAYNLTLTPKRNLLRLAPYLQSILYQRNGAKITFQTSSKNRDLVANLGSGPIAESGDLTLPIATPIFQPNLIKMKAIMPPNWQDLQSYVPYGYYTGTTNGVPFKVFPNKDGQTDAERQAVDLECIAHPDTDTSTFKRSV